MNWNTILLASLFALLISTPDRVNAACSNNTDGEPGIAGEIEYFSSDDMFRYCNDNIWVDMAVGGSGGDITLESSDIVYNTSSNVSSFTTSSFSASGGKNNLLIAFVYFQGAGTGATRVTNMSYGGVAMQEHGHRVNDFGAVAAFTLNDPPSGSNTADIDLDGDSRATIVTLHEYTNVAEISPVVSSNEIGGTDGTTTLSHNMTTSFDEARLVMGATVQKGGYQFSPGTDVNEWQDASTPGTTNYSDITVFAGDKQITTAGADSISATASGNFSDWASIAIELRPLSADLSFSNIEMISHEIVLNDTTRLYSPVTTSSFTASGGEENLLVASIYMVPEGDNIDSHTKLTNVTFGGERMYNASYQFNRFASLSVFILRNPPSGAGTLDIEFDTSTRALVVALSEFANVDQSSSVSGLSEVNGTDGSTTFAHNVTTSHDNTILFMPTIVLGGLHYYESDADVFEIHDVPSSGEANYSDLTSALHIKEVATAGSANISATASGNDGDYASAALQINEGTGISGSSGDGVVLLGAENVYVRTSTNVSSFSTNSFEATGGSETMLLAFVHYMGHSSGSASDVNSVSYGGQAMSKLGNYSNQWGSIGLFSLSNPPSGANTANVVLNGSARAAAVNILEYANVDTGASGAVSGSNNTNGATSFTESITTSQDESKLVMGVTVQQGGFWFDQEIGAIELIDLDSGGTGGFSDITYSVLEKEISVTGAASIATTSSDNNSDWASVAVELVPGSGTTPLPYSPSGVSTGESCSHEGVLRYNSSNNIIEWCDGENFVYTASPEPAAGSGGCLDGSQEAALNYDSASNTFYFCNGDDLVAIE